MRKQAAAAIIRNNDNKMGPNKLKWHKKQEIKTDKINTANK